MEPSSSTLVPIASLDPSQDVSPPHSQSIRGQITLSWPYSSSTKSCAFLVVDRDFRLRSKKGQVRVRFSGPSASAVARAKIGIGDEVVLQLQGAKWVEEDAGMAQRTPGRSVGVELEFGGRLGLKIVRAAGDVDVLVDEAEENAVPAEDTVEDIEEDVTELNAMVTPGPKVIAKLREEGSLDAGMHIYSSPAFAKRLRLSGENFLDSAYDPFADEKLDVDRVRKRQRLSFGGQWRYAKSESPIKSRSPSPTPAMEEPVVQQQTTLEGSHQNDVQGEAASTTTLPDAEMLPPVLPAPQIPSSPVESPSTPEIRPVSSAALPLPSPFPDDSRRSWLVDSADISTLPIVEEDEEESADADMTEPTMEHEEPEAELVQGDNYPEENDVMEIEAATTGNEVEEPAPTKPLPQPETGPESAIKQLPSLERSQNRTSLPGTPTHASRRDFGGLDGTFSSPALHSTPQSERDRIMKQTVQSLFGFQKSPEPKEVPEQPRDESPSPDFQFGAVDGMHAAGDHTEDTADTNIDTVTSDFTGPQPLQGQDEIVEEGFGFDQYENQASMPDEPAKEAIIEVIDLDSDSEDDAPSIAEQPESVVEDSPHASEVEEGSVEESVATDEDIASQVEGEVDSELEEEIRSQLSRTEEDRSEEDLPADAIEVIEDEESEKELVFQPDPMTTMEGKDTLPSHDAEHEIAIFGQPVEELRPEPDMAAVEAIDADDESARPTEEEAAVPEEPESDSQLVKDVSQVATNDNFINEQEMQMMESAESQFLLDHMLAEQQTTELQQTGDPSLSQTHSEQPSTLHSTLDQSQPTSEPTLPVESIAEAIDLASPVEEIAPSQAAARKTNTSALEHFSSYHRTTDRRLNGEQTTTIDHQHNHEEVAEEAETEIQQPEDSTDHAPNTAPTLQVSYPELPMSPSNSQSQEQRSFNLRSRDPVAKPLPPLPLTPQASDLKMPESSANEVKMPESSAKETKTSLRRSARKSFAARLSHVPDTVAQWFSPKSNAKTESAGPKTAAKAIRTSKGYFTPLSQIERHLNPSSSQGAGNGVDVLAVVTDKPKLPSRAKAGPRDFFTVFRVRDTSFEGGEDVKVEIYRPWKASLPAAEVGDVVLLRQFGVRSKKRHPYLLSNDASAWCVWRFSDAGSIAEEDEESDPAKSQRELSNGIILGDKLVREEIKGPPVELDDEERRHAKDLHNWWLQTSDPKRVTNKEMQ